MVSDKVEGVILGKKAAVGTNAMTPIEAFPTPHREGEPLRRCFNAFGMFYSTRPRAWNNV